MGEWAVEHSAPKSSERSHWMNQGIRGTPTPKARQRQRAGMPQLLRRFSKSGGVEPFAEMYYAFLTIEASEIALVLADLAEFALVL